MIVDITIALLFFSFAIFPALYIGFPLYCFVPFSILAIFMGVVVCSLKPKRILISSTDIKLFLFYLVYLLLNFIHIQKYQVITIGRVLQNFLIFLAAYLVLRLIRYKKIDLMYKYFVVALFINSIFSFLQILGYLPTDAGRAFGLFDGEPNHFALFCSIGLMLFLGKMLRGLEPRILIIVMLCMINLIFSLSVSILISTLFAILFLFKESFHLQGKSAFYAAILLVLILPLFIFLASFFCPNLTIKETIYRKLYAWFYFLKTFDFKEAFNISPSATYRLIIWHNLLGEFNLKSFIVGKGYKPEIVIDNTYLRIIYEGGIVAFFAFFIFLKSLFKKLAGIKPRELRLSLIGTWIIFLIAGISFDTFFQTRNLGILLMLTSITINAENYNKRDNENEKNNPGSHYENGL
jgi:hypothetical protein